MAISDNTQSALGVVAEYEDNTTNRRYFEIAPDVVLRVTLQNNGRYDLTTFDASNESWAVIQQHDNDWSYASAHFDSVMFDPLSSLLELSESGTSIISRYSIGNDGTFSFELDHRSGTTGIYERVDEGYERIGHHHDLYHDFDNGFIYQQNYSSDGLNARYGDEGYVRVLDLNYKDFRYQGPSSFGRVAGEVKLPFHSNDQTAMWCKQVAILGDLIYVSLGNINAPTASSQLFALALEPNGLDGLTVQDSFVIPNDVFVKGLLSDGTSLYVLSTQSSHSGTYLLSKYDREFNLDLSFANAGTLDLSQAFMPLGISGSYWVEAIYANELGVITLQVNARDEVDRTMISSKLISVDFMGFVDVVPNSERSGTAIEHEVTPSGAVIQETSLARADGTVISGTDFVLGLNVAELNTAFDETSVADGDDISVSERSLINVGSESLAVGSDDVDVFNLSGDSSVINGNGGADRINSNQSSNSYIDGGAGDDLIKIENSTLWVRDDVVARNVSDLGVATGKTISLNDVYSQNSALVVGGSGEDTLTFGSENDAIVLHDFFSTHNESEKLSNLIGNVARNPRFEQVEVINGGAGNDLIDFSSIAFRQTGLTLQGGDGSDIIWGGDSDEIIEGGTGDDRINGGFGNDILTGGTGVDRFEFTITSGDDLITDFEKGADKLEFYLRDGFGEAETDAMPTFNGNTVALGSYQIEVTFVGGGILDESDYSIHWI